MKRHERQKPKTIEEIPTIDDRKMGKKLSRFGAKALAMAMSFAVVADTPGTAEQPESHEKISITEQFPPDWCEGRDCGDSYESINVFRVFASEAERLEPVEPGRWLQIEQAQEEVSDRMTYDLEGIRVVGDSIGQLTGPIYFAPEGIEKGSGEACYANPQLEGIVNEVRGNYSAFMPKSITRIVLEHPLCRDAEDPNNNGTWAGLSYNNSGLEVYDKAYIGLPNTLIHEGGHTTSSNYDFREGYAYFTIDGVKVSPADNVDEGKFLFKKKGHASHVASVECQPYGPYAGIHNIVKDIKNFADNEHGCWYQKDLNSGEKNPYSYPGSIMGNSWSDERKKKGAPDFTTSDRNAMYPDDFVISSIDINNEGGVYELEYGRNKVNGVSFDIPEDHPLKLIDKDIHKVQITLDIQQQLHNPGDKYRDCKSGDFACRVNVVAVARESGRDYDSQRYVLPSSPFPYKIDNQGRHAIVFMDESQGQNGVAFELVTTPDGRYLLQRMPYGEALNASVAQITGHEECVRIRVGENPIPQEAKKAGELCDVYHR